MLSQMEHILIIQCVCMVQCACVVQCACMVQCVCILGVTVTFSYLSGENIHIYTVKDEVVTVFDVIVELWITEGRSSFNPVMNIL